jgi:pimeloyl-ACP methyl ester carboxylesterase
MGKIYCISGLGADKRVFVNLKLNDKVTHIKWIKPLANEQLCDYAKRLTKDQIVNDGNVTLIGVSFGGIIAVEISKIIKVKHVVIISSVCTTEELPPFLSSRTFKYFKFLMSPIIIKTFPGLAYPIFGAEKKDEKILLKSIIKDTDLDFMKWAIQAMAIWKNETIPSNLIHIHGTKDRVFEFSRMKSPVMIDGGTHLMVYNRADEISKIINNNIEYP